MPAVSTASEPFHQERHVLESFSRSLPLLSGRNERVVSIRRPFQQERGLTKRNVDLLSMHRLGAREREIMEALFAQNEATVAEVLASLDSPPSYSAVRGMLALLEQKGYVKHRRDGLRYVYSPSVNTAAAKGPALRKLVDTFFGGSPARAVATLLQLPENPNEELTIKELRKAVLAARKQGR